MLISKNIGPSNKFLYRLTESHDIANKERTPRSAAVD